MEMPKGFALYLDGEIINLEGDWESEGDRFEKIHWQIDKVEVSESFVQKGYSEDEVKSLIKEAFTSYSYCDYEPEQIEEVTVEIKAEFQQKEN